MPDSKKQAVRIVTSENFDELIKSKKPVLIDFSASWCGPCQMMAPVIHEMGESEGEKDYIVASLDIDEVPDIAARYNVMSVPTFMIFQDGKDVARMLGAMPKEMIESKIREFVK